MNTRRRCGGDPRFHSAAKKWHLPGVAWQFVTFVMVDEDGSVSIGMGLGERHVAQKC